MHTHAISHLATILSPPGIEDKTSLLFIIPFNFLIHVHIFSTFFSALSSTGDDEDASVYRLASHHVFTVIAEILQLAISTKYGRIKLIKSNNNYERSLILYIFYICSQTPNYLFFIIYHMKNICNKVR